MAEQAKSLDLANLFQIVTGTLVNNRQELNNADENNHDHGDNMMDTFEVITQAMKEKRGADPADQLAYASEILRQCKSGSSQLYAKGLEQASQQFQGHQGQKANDGFGMDDLRQADMAFMSTKSRGAVSWKRS